MTRARHDYKQGMADGLGLARRSLTTAYAVLADLATSPYHADRTAYTNGYADGIAAMEVKFSNLLAAVEASE